MPTEQARPAEGAAPGQEPLDPEGLSCALLGLPRPQEERAPLRVGEARLGGEGASLLVPIGERDSEILVEIRAKSAGAPAYRSTPQLALSYRGPAAPPTMDELCARLGEVSWEQILALIARTEFPSRRSSEDGEAQPAIEGIHQRWGGADRWRVFLATREIARAQSEAIRTDSSQTHIEHADAECQSVGVGDFVAYPWRSPWEDGARARDEEVGRAHYFTDMDDADVIHGGTDRMEELLEAIDAEPGEQTLTVHCTCVSMMIGDDVRGSVDSRNVGRSLPIIYGDQRSQPFDRQLDALGKRLRDAPAHEPTPGLVNLLGFREGRGLRELSGLLLEAGVRVHRSMVPEMTFQRMDDYDRACAQIMLPIAEWNALMEKLVGYSARPTLRAEPPYGMEASLRWIEAVGAAAGQAGAAKDAASRRRAELAPRWDALRARARGIGVGLVFDPADVFRLAKPEHLFALPLLAMLEEMGLDWHLAVFDGGRANRAAIQKSVEALLADRGRHRIDWFRTPEELTAWLREGAHPLVYTDYLYDRRITGAGKTPVTTHTFELGPEGAVRSLERLLRLAELPFYARFGRHLPHGAVL